MTGSARRGIRREPVVVTGIGVINALGRDAEEFWANLVAGRSGVRPATNPDFDGLKDVFLGEVEDSWVAEGLPAGAEPSGRMAALALVAARQAIGDSGLAAGQLAGEPVAVVMGQCQVTPGPNPMSFLPFHEAADAVAAQWDLTGPRAVISTACAAGGNAVGMGRDMLWDGSAEIVLAGGVDDLQRGSQLGFDLLGAISPQATAPYSRSDGLSLGEGGAFLVLETAAHAAARGARVLAEVGGYGLSADAYHATAPDPTGKGPLRAVSRALTESGLTPDDISYVNGHGTGTPTNDRMERKAMRSLFGPRLPEVPMSSTKAALGHSLGASGAIEAVTCILALTHQTAPPTVNFDAEPPADIDFVPAVGRPTRVDVTLSNNYAFGGNNCSLLLARPGRLERAAPDRAEIPRRVLISGIGVVSGFGLGADAWREGVRSGRSAVDRIKSFDASEHATEYAVEGYPLGSKPLAAAGLWRHLGGYGRYSVAATAMAFQDAGVRTNGPGRDGVGLVFATGYGPVRTALDLAAGMRSPEGARAVDFANATVNAAAGAVCQAMTLRGPTTTIAHGGASAVMALGTAVQLIDSGATDRVLLLAVDEFCEAILAMRGDVERMSVDGLVRPYDATRNGTVLGSAAVALLIEAEDAVAARGGTAYAEVLGVTHQGVRNGDEAAAARTALTGLLERSGGPEPVDLVAGAGSGGERDRAELQALHDVLGAPTRLTAPKALTGECEAASGAVNLVTAALAVAEGLVPANPFLERPEPGLQHVTEPLTDAVVRRAVATAASPMAAYAAALLAPA